MTQPAVSRTGEQAPPATSTTAPATRERLTTGEGQISVAEGVVQKIAGKACREMGGVHAMGTSGSRMFGTIRERIPGSTGPNFSQGVGVEVGETEAAVDLDIVVEYGVSIAELGRSIQRNVKQAVERMTGLRVVEVNIAVDDVYLPGDGDEDTASAQVFPPLVPRQLVAAVHIDAVSMQHRRAGKPPFQVKAIRVRRVIVNDRTRSQGAQVLFPLELALHIVTVQSL